VAGQAFPPMDRHARKGEDAASAQRRLYRESLGLREKKKCRLCGRVGVSGFVDYWEPAQVWLDGPDVAGDRVVRGQGFRCESETACARRLPVDLRQNRAWMMFRYMPRVIAAASKT
jgi:hypothetical protein